MRQMKLAWVLPLIIGLFGLAGGVYFTARPPAQESSYKPVLPDGVQVALEGTSRVTSSESGRMAWTMTNTGLSFYQGQGVVAVTGPRAWIPMAEGGTVEVASDTGRYYQASQDITMTGAVRVRLDRAGKPEWVLDGDTASYRRVEEAFYLSGLEGVVNSSPEEAAAVKGERGRYDVRARTMSLSGGVFCRWEKGVTLETDRLEYSLDAKTAVTDSEVLIRGEGFRLQGVGMAADLSGRRVVVKQSVKLVLDQGMKGVK